jgi:hypothetical protein
LRQPLDNGSVIENVSADESGQPFPVLLRPAAINVAN